MNHKHKISGIMLKILLLESQTYLESLIVPTTVLKTEFGKIAAEANSQYDRNWK